MKKQILHITHQLSMREIKRTDARLVFQTIQQHRIYLGEWLPFVAQTVKLEDSIEFIESILKVGESQREKVYCLFWEQHFCGLIGFRDTDRQSLKTEIGYWISEDYQRKGIATAATKFLTDTAFSNLGFKQVIIRCAEGNWKSRRIPEKLGFKMERIVKNGELMSDGRFIDLCIYSMQAHDWSF